MKHKFVLECLYSGEIFEPSEYIPSDCKESLLVTRYEKKKIEVKNLPGIWKYIDWLPTKTIPKEFLKNPAGPLTYKSKKLAEYLGLKNLYISYNGFHEGINNTGSFKDIEAQSTISRWIDIGIIKEKIPILASDGNFARGVIYYTKWLNLPLIVSTIEDARKKRIWSPNGGDYNKNTFLISLIGEHDYYDAIELAKRLSNLDFTFSEGGVKNVARRDGVGTILIDAAIKMKRIPDHYFQGVGTGVGPIAIYEANERLVNDSRFENHFAVIHISQNFPFDPIVNAWREKIKKIDEKFQGEEGKKLIKKVLAHVLTNRRPAYEIRGGLYDILKATDGYAYSIKNEEIIKAKEIFKKLEGKEILDASAVTVASLVKAVEEGNVDKNDYILINVTGGGINELKNTQTIPANFKTSNMDEVFNFVEKYFKK